MRRRCMTCDTYDVPMGTLLDEARELHRAMHGIWLDVIVPTLVPVLEPVALWLSRHLPDAWGKSK